MTQIEHPVYLDANVLVYAMETDGENGILARRWLMQIDRGRVRAVTSELSLVEVLPFALQTGNVVLAEGYRRLFKGSAHLTIAPVSSPVIEKAVTLRAELKGETPDTIHAATAVVSGCRGFVTNDARLKLPADVIRYEISDVMRFYG